MIPSGELPQGSEAGCDVPGASREALGEASGAHNHQAHDQSCSLHLHTAGTSRIVQTHCGCPPVLVTSYGCIRFFMSWLYQFLWVQHKKSSLEFHHSSGSSHTLPSQHTLHHSLACCFLVASSPSKPMEPTHISWHKWGVYDVSTLWKTIIRLSLEKYFFHCVTLFKFLSSLFFSLPASYTLQNMKYLPNIT